MIHKMVSTFPDANAPGVIGPNAWNAEHVQSIVNLSTNTNLALTYDTILATGSPTLTLPDATTCKGQPYLFKNVGSGIITLNTTAGQTIDGASALFLSTPEQTANIFSNGTNWSLADPSSQQIAPSLLNVKSFGATGNGTTDDTAAIQSAINACTASQPGIFFPSGTYLISSTLNGTANLQIVQGASPTASVITTNGANITAFQTLFAPIAFQMVDIGFNGPVNTSTPQTDLVIVSSASNLGVVEGGLFENVWINNASGAGLRLTVPITTKVSNCRFAFCGQYGVIATGGTSVNFENCYALRCLMTGYELDEMSYSSLSACAADFCGQSYRLYLGEAISLLDCEHEAGLALNATITATAVSGGVATVTYSSSYDLSMGNYIVNRTQVALAGTSGGGGALNGRWTLTGATSSTLQFSVSTGNFSGSDSGTASTFPGDGVVVDTCTSVSLLNFYGTDSSQTTSTHIQLTDSTNILVQNPISTLSTGQLQTYDLCANAGVEFMDLRNPSFVGGINNQAVNSQVLLNNTYVTPIILATENAATSGANQNSPSLELEASYWTGSAAATDEWTMGIALGSGSNPQSSLQFVHSGSSGDSAAQFYLGSSSNNGEFDVIQNTLATNSNNYDSPLLGLFGRYYSAGGSSTLDEWALQNVIGTGTSPATTLQITHPTGSPGALAIQIPSGAVFQFSTDTGISRASAGVIDVGNGSAGNASGTLNAAQYNVAGSQIAAANLSNGTTGSGSIVLAAAPTITGSVTLSGTIGSYDGVTTVLGGFAPIVKSGLYSAQTANLGTTSFIAASALPANGMLRISIQVVCVTAATTGSATSTLPAPQITFQERYSNTSQTITLTPTNNASATANTVGTTLTFHADISIRSASAVSVATTGYASNTANQMAYTMIVNAEYFGG